MLQKIHKLGKKMGVFSIFHWFCNKSRRTIPLSHVMLFLWTLLHQSRCLHLCFTCQAYGIIKKNENIYFLCFLWIECCALFPQACCHYLFSSLPFLLIQTLITKSSRKKKKRSKKSFKIDIYQWEYEMLFQWVLSSPELHQSSSGHCSKCHLATSLAAQCPEGTKADI